MQDYNHFAEKYLKQNFIFVMKQRWIVTKTLAGIDFGAKYSLS